MNGRWMDGRLDVFEQAGGVGEDAEQEAAGLELDHRVELGDCSWRPQYLPSLSSQGNV